MNKPYTKLWLIAALFGCMCPTFAQNYSIQLGTFTEPVASTFFDFSGFSNVKYRLSDHRFHHYTWGEFEDAKTAEEQLALIRSKAPFHNLTNLKIIPQTATESTISNHIHVEKTPNQVTGFQLFSRSIVFNEVNLSLQKTDVSKLEEIRDILNKHPALKLRIIATNNNSSLNIQQQRTATNIIKNFLLANQIPAYRVKIIPNSTESENDVQKIAPTIPPVIMTLVDLKEEIVLDKFGTNQLFAKELLEQKTNNVLE